AAVVTLMIRMCFSVYTMLSESCQRMVIVGYLNNQNQLIAGETLFTGTINRTEVHPREVIKRALYHNAAAVVLAHNHPSGEVTPSKADRLITERLVQALGLVDIRVPDHLIVGGNQVFSFAEHGLL
ncbi:TPA: JAB domain-containing protein, partial [Escherichia coli]